MKRQRLELPDQTFQRIDFAQALNRRERHVVLRSERIVAASPAAEGRDPYLRGQADFNIAAEPTFIAGS